MRGFCRIRPAGGHGPVRLFVASLASHVKKSKVDARLSNESESRGSSHPKFLKTGILKDLVDLWEKSASETLNFYDGCSSTGVTGI